MIWLMLLTTTTNSTYKVPKKQTLIRSEEDKYGMIAELTQEGQVINSWQSPTGPFNQLSEGYLHTDGYIYLGSPYNNYVARLKYE